MGIFNDIFSGQRLTHPLSLKDLQVDLHSHLIPAIDDGVNSFEEALALITRLKELGIKKIITTPHIKQDYYRNTPEIIMRGQDSLKHFVEQAGIEIEIEAAAEYLIDDGFEEKLKAGNLMTFGDKYVLVELSYYDPHPNLSSILFNLQIEGYNIILAHPERYTYWYNDFRKFEELKNRGVFFQLNIISLGGSLSSPQQKFIDKLISAGMIEFLGTDMHNMMSLERLEMCLYTKTLEKLLKSGKILNPKFL